MAYGLQRMVQMLRPDAIGYQLYAEYARLASEIFLSSPHGVFFSRLLKFFDHEALE